jgi:hypothetical protein
MNKNTKKEYVDPILIEEGFFKDEEDYVRTMDKMFEGLRRATKKEAMAKQIEPSHRTPSKKE